MSDQQERLPVSHNVTLLSVRCPRHHPALTSICRWHWLLLRICSAIAHETMHRRRHSVLPSGSVSSALVMYSAELIMSSLTVLDMIGLSVGKGFASAASNSGLNWSSTARNVSNAFRISMRRSCTVWHALSSVNTLENDLQCSLCVVLQSCGGREQSVTAQTWWRCVRHREQWRL